MKLQQTYELPLLFIYLRAWLLAGCVSMHTEGHSTSQLDQAFPWFSSILEQMLSRYSKRTLHNFRESITKCSDEINNKLINTRQHNKYLLEYIGYMCRHVNRSSSDLQQNKSWVHSPKVKRACPKCQIPTHVLTCFNQTLYVSYFIQYQILCTFTNLKILESQYLNSTRDLFCWRPDDDLLTGRNM